MKSWLICVLCVALISIIVSGLLPNGKTQKVVNKSIGIAFLVIIFSPIISFFNGGMNSLQNQFDFSYKEDYEYVDYSNEYLIKCISLDIKKQLSSDGFHNADVSIDFTTNNDEILINNVIVNVSHGVIESETEHINKCKKIVSCVKKYLDLPEEKIIVIFE